jgi:iron complex transport system ATP-binding protein
MSLLRAEQLVVTLGGRDVLRDVSFTLGEGEFVGLLGPNGAGKSTLIKAVLGLVPSAGAVTMDGRDLAALTPSARAKLMAYLPQDRDIAWDLTAEAIVALGRIPHRRPMQPLSAADERAIAAAMAQTDISHLRGRSVAEMSGGERNRTLIARALAQDAPVLMADEPVAGLDPAHQIATMELFSALADRGGTVLVTLHELHLAARWCRRILMLDKGCVVCDGTPAEVLTPERLAAVYGVETYRADTPHGLVIMPVARHGDAGPDGSPGS